jgi:hypothetical protein
MVHFDSFVSHFLLKTAKFQSEAEALQVFQCGKRTLYHMPLTDTTPTKKKATKTMTERGTCLHRSCDSAMALQS